MKNILTTKELGDQLFDTQKERQENPEKWRGLPFGHTDLDKSTGGARRGELTVIAGAQKIGKTTVAKDVCMSMGKKLRTIKSDEFILYISLEMSHEGLGARVFANEANIDITRFRDYELDDNDFKRLKNSIEEMADVPALWDTGTYSYKDLLKIIDHYTDVEGVNKIRAIIIDYFQLFSSEGLPVGTARHEQLSALSRALKQFARETNSSVIVLSQQSRTALTSFKKRKDPNTLAGTQALVRDCDLLIIILEKLDEDKEEIPHMRELYVGLARNSRADQSYDTIFVGKYARTGAPLGDEGNLDDLESTPDTIGEIRDWWNDN